MILENNNDWQIVAGVTTIAAVASLAIWLVMRRRPTAEEIERTRREFLVQSGRLVDGMLLDVYEAAGEGGRMITYLLFNYCIGGVNYECSQEITSLSGTVAADEVRAGFPCSVRYQPGNPQNSIVIAENWSGLRAKLPQFPALEGSRRPDRGHLRSSTR